VRLREDCPAGALVGRAETVTVKMPCRRHVYETLPLLMPSGTICRLSSGVRSTRGLLPLVPPVLEALTLARCAVQFWRGTFQVGTGRHLSGNPTNHELRTFPKHNSAAVDNETASVLNVAFR
jgi:hypothetical protein